nr:MAG TPA: hypothetical protein [Caudoviricetes sp.]
MLKFLCYRNYSHTGEKYKKFIRNSRKRKRYTLTQGIRLIPFVKKSKKWKGKGGD